MNHLKVVILAGGLGTRLSEETSSKPKPMVEIGGMPILWHIMKIYHAQGVRDFIVCCGYKGYVIKEWFANYNLHNSDVFIDGGSGEIKYLDNSSEDWRITLIDTGLHAMTGGRLLAVSEYLEGEAIFGFTYGDGVADINLAEQINFHKQHGKLATVTAVNPPGRFGNIGVDENNQVTKFNEKKALSNDPDLINGGFFLLDPAVLKLIDTPMTIWEQEPMRKLAASNQLAAYRHDGFWKPMDTLRDKIELEDLWESSKAPWKLWDKNV